MVSWEKLDGTTLQRNIENERFSLDCLKLHSLTFLLPIKVENQMEKKRTDAIFSEKFSESTKKSKLSSFDVKFFFKISNNIYHFEFFHLGGEDFVGARITSQARVEIESFFDGEDFSETLTRAKFEELNMDLFRTECVTESGKTMFLMSEKDHISFLLKSLPNFSLCCLFTQFRLFSGISELIHIFCFRSILVE